MKSLMKMMSLPVSLLLMANNVSGFTRCYSYIAKDDFICKEQLCDYSQESISTLSNVKNDIVATLTINYEVFQMGKNTEVIPGYHPGYVFLYQADVYINNKVQYKGGLFNWFDGCHAGFLNYIELNTTFNGVGNVNHSYFTPSLETNDGDTGYKFLLGVSPLDHLYTEDSSYTDKQTENNTVLLGTYNDELDSFTDAINVYSNSYYYSVYDLIRRPTDFLGKYDSRILADVSSSKDIFNNKIKFKQRFDYNNMLEVTYHGISDAPECHVNHDKKGLYSGPCANGADLDKPFNFSFFGAIGVESENRPTSIDFEMKMDTFHGSQVNLDTFESSASDSFTIRL